MIREGKYSNWKEVTPIVNKELYPDDIDYKNESTFRKQAKYARDFYEAGVFNKYNEDGYAQELWELKRELQKERVKLQTEKVEYSRWIREDARDEMFIDKVVESIRSNVKPVKIKEIKSKENKRAGQLIFTDPHFGKEFIVHGLHNEIINKYSPEIFYSRMETLLSDSISIIEKEQFDIVHVNNLGDHVEGFIRNSQLWSLRYGVIDSAIHFGNYMSEWLQRLSSKVKVIYHQTDGNHDEMRLLDGKKNEHLNESAGKIIKNIIQIKNENNPNFELRENKTGFIFYNIAGYNILGIHGEVRNLETAIKEYSDLYDVRIDYLIAGHKHHTNYKNCGVRKGVIGVGSIVGIDDFSMRIRKAADATASFVIYEEEKGKVCEHTIVLN